MGRPIPGKIEKLRCWGWGSTVVHVPEQHRLQMAFYLHAWQQQNKVICSGTGMVKDTLRKNGYTYSMTFLNS